MPGIRGLSRCKFCRGLQQVRQSSKGGTEQTGNSSAATVDASVDTARIVRHDDDADRVVDVLMALASPLKDWTMGVTHNRPTQATPTDA